MKKAIITFEVGDTWAQSLIDACNDPIGKGLPPDHIIGFRSRGRSWYISFCVGSPEERFCRQVIIHNPSLEIEE